MRLDARHRGRHREAEIRIRAEVGVLERTVERGGDQCAGRLDRHTAADAVDAAGPAGVDQPDVDIVLLDVVAQQVGIDRRIARQERRAEAGREFRLHAHKTLLGTGHLGGVTRQEVVHRLGRRQLGNRRHDAEGVGRQEDDVLRMTGATAARSIRDEVERIGRAGILGLAVVIVVRLAGVFIEGDILQHRAEAVGGVPDHRLRFLGELDGLGVAAAFEIEDAVRTPAGFVVADERAVRVGRQRGLAGARQAEEQRALLAVRRDVGRAVHRHDVLGRKVEIQCREHRLLHLARVRTAADQNDLVGEIDRNLRVGAFAAAMTLGVRLERRQIDDGEFGREGGQFSQFRTDQKLADEQRVPGIFGEDADLDAIGRIGAAVEVLREQLLAFAVRAEVGEHRGEVVLRHLAVAFPPQDVMRQIVVDRVLVLRRAAGVMAGEGRQGAALDDGRFLGGNRMLVQRGLGQIPVNLGEIFQTEFVRAIGTVAHTSLNHQKSSHSGRLFTACPSTSRQAPHGRRPKV